MEKYMTSGLQDRKIIWLKDSKTEKFQDSQKENENGLLAPSNKN